MPRPSRATAHHPAKKCADRDACSLPRAGSFCHPLLPFTLRQGAQARDDFAQIMDELDFVKELLARLPTRSDQAFTPLRIMFGSAVLSATLVIGWIEAFWRHSL